MLMQRGKFTINDMSQIDDIESDKDGIRKVISLDYMGQFEFEGNAIPISRMFIEYHKENYEFIPTNIYSSNKEELFIYINKDILKEKDSSFIYTMAEKICSREYSIYEYINYPNECDTNFWWDIDADYMLFFGKEKKEIIKYFIDSCYIRDGEKEIIKKKLTKVGYRL